MKYNSGFTIWELVIVVSIIAILSNLAIPMMRDHMFELQSRSIATEIEDGFRFARAESLRLGMPISICAAKISINNVLHGCNAKARNKDWSSGMLAFINKDNLFKYDPENRVRYALFENGLISNINIISNNAYYIVYPDSIIDSNKDDDINYYCFWFSQKAMKPRFKNILVINQYGVSNFCTASASDFQNCAKLCAR
ncbi:MAG: prepilin-type N-terminal cleavage/methylation domain-containing protein [Burkholderiales bacterium]|nr:prepilin-type N-terminal cleavage/methylation domain-containing protein [Burkholderiales bacterium]